MKIFGWGEIKIVFEFPAKNSKLLGSGENFGILGLGENFRLGRKFWVQVKMLGLGENFWLGRKFWVQVKMLG